MVTWSVRTYVVNVVVVTPVLLFASVKEIVDVRDVIIGISDYVATLSVALIVFPLVAIPLMLDVSRYAVKHIGEKPHRGFYDDFNNGCLLVSIGSLVELILLFIVKTIPASYEMLGMFVASLALANLIACILMFSIIILVLRKVVSELKYAFTVSGREAI